MIIPYGRNFLLFLSIMLTAFAAGAVNGLFGMGGGIIIYFLLCRLYAGKSEYSTKDIFAMTVISVLIMSLSSVFLYFSSGKTEISAALPYLIPAVLGGVAGAFALSYIKASILKKIFALIMIYGGVSLVLRK